MCSRRCSCPYLLLSFPSIGGVCARGRRKLWARCCRRFCTPRVQCRPCRVWIQRHGRSTTGFHAALQPYLERMVPSTDWRIERRERRRAQRDFWQAEPCPRLRRRSVFFSAPGHRTTGRCQEGLRPWTRPHLRYARPVVGRRRPKSSSLVYKIGCCWSGVVAWLLERVRWPSLALRAHKRGRNNAPMQICRRHQPHVQTPAGCSTLVVHPPVF